MTGDASKPSKPKTDQIAENDLPTPGEIARGEAIEAARDLKTARQFPAEHVGGEESSLLYPPVTPRRR